MKRVEVNGHRYLIAPADGKVYAVDDTCSHEDMSLYLGCLQGKLIKCSLHDSRFSLETGQAMEPPADGPIGTYQVKASDGQIWLNPGRRIND